MACTPKKHTHGQLVMGQSGHEEATSGPDAQEQLIATPISCLTVLDRVVIGEAEKLYGVRRAGAVRRILIDTDCHG